MLIKAPIHPLTTADYMTLVRASVASCGAPSRPTVAILQPMDCDSYIVGTNSADQAIKAVLGDAVYERPQKYSLVKHAEQHVIGYAARLGISTEGASLYMNWFPCAACARLLVGARVTHLVGYRPDFEDDSYDFIHAHRLLETAGVWMEFVGECQEEAA